jgi:membrane protein YqaA with SNARE-associated domain
VVLASLTSSVTTLIGDHGLYAVFVLMAVDAVFPAASELVMLYAGALAAGAFSGQHVVLFGDRIDSHFWAYVAMSLAGTIGYTIGSLVGWGIGAYAGRPLLEERGRWFHLDRAKLDRADRWFERWGDWAVFLGRLTPWCALSSRSPPGSCDADRSLHGAHLPRLRHLVLRNRRRGLGARVELRTLPSRFRLCRICRRCAVIVFVVWLILRWRSSVAQARSERS